ncbi:hypothetical protein LTR95_009998 [Oleoguttula sp. CCFEE 5521]
MDRAFARGGAMQMTMPGGLPGMPMQSPMGTNMATGYGNMAGFANEYGSGPYGGGCGTPWGMMGPGPWPGGWKPSSEWTVRDYSMLREILDEYSAREKRKGRLPWGPWSDMMPPPWCPPPPPPWAGSSPWTDHYTSSGCKPWDAPSRDKDIDALLAARLRQMSAGTDPLLQTQESAAAKLYAEQQSEIRDMLFGSSAEQKQKQYQAKLSQTIRNMQASGMMNDPASLAAQVQQLQAQVAAALAAGGGAMPGIGSAAPGGRDPREELRMRAAMAELRQASRGGGLRGNRRQRGGFDAEDDDWGDEWNDDDRGGGGRSGGNRGGRTNGRSGPRRGPPRRPRPNNGGSGAAAFPDAAASSTGGFDRPFHSTPYATQPQPLNPTALPSNPPFRSTIPVPQGSQPQRYPDEPYYPSRPAGPSPPTPDRPLTPVASTDLPHETRRPLSPMPMPRPGGPGGMSWGYGARVEEVNEKEGGIGIGLNRPPTYVSQEDMGAGGAECRPGMGARHVSFGDIGRGEPPLSGVKEV